MSLLTDAFIATEEELAAAAALSKDYFNPIDFFPTLQGKNIDDIKLLALEAVVMEQDFPSTEADIEIIRQRITGDDDGPWIYRFPDTLVEGLARLTLDEINGYGEAWVATEEFHDHTGRPPSNIGSILSYLHDLCSLAAQAQAERKHLYMWMSL